MQGWLRQIINTIGEVLKQNPEASHPQLWTSLYDCSFAMNLLSAHEKQHYKNRCWYLISDNNMPELNLKVSSHNHRSMYTGKCMHMFSFTWSPWDTDWPLPHHMEPMLWHRNHIAPTTTLLQKSHHTARPGTHQAILVCSTPDPRPLHGVLHVTKWPPST